MNAIELRHVFTFAYLELTNLHAPLNIQACINEQLSEWRIEHHILGWQTFQVSPINADETIILVAKAIVKTEDEKYVESLEFMIENLEPL